MNALNLKQLFLITLLAFLSAVILWLLENKIRSMDTSAEKNIVFIACGTEAGMTREDVNNEKQKDNKKGNSCSHQQPVASLLEKKKRKQKLEIMHCT